MNISWTYGCGVARRVYGKTLLFLLLVYGLGGAAFACPYPEDIDINLKTVCVGMYSLVSFSTEPGDTNFSITTTKVTTVPDPSAGAQVIDDGMTVVWNEAGKYSVAITVKITSTAATVPVPAIREVSATKTVTVVKVDSISTNSNLSVTTYPICVTNGSTVTFYAKPDPADIEEWPDGKPVWKNGDEEIDSGVDRVDVTFNTPGINYVTAECGNTVKVAVFVITNYTIVASSTNIALSNTVTATAWTLNEQGAPVTVASDWTIPSGSGLAEFVGDANGVDTVTIKGVAASSVIGDIEVHAEDSGNPALADDEWFTVIKVDLDNTDEKDFFRSTSDAMSITVTPSSYADALNVSLEGFDGQHWTATFNETTRKINLVNLIEDSDPMAWLDKQMLSISAGITGVASGWSWTKELDLKKRMDGIKDNIMDGLANTLATQFTTAPGEYAGGLVYDQMGSIAQIDSNGIERRFNDIRRSEVRNLVKEKINSAWSDFTGTTIRGNIDSQDLHDQVTDESWTWKWNTKLTISATGGNVSVDQGGNPHLNPGDWIRAVNDFGWSQKLFEPQKASLTSTLTGDGHVGHALFKARLFGDVSCTFAGYEDPETHEMTNGGTFSGLTVGLMLECWF